MEWWWVPLGVLVLLAAAIVPHTVRLRRLRQKVQQLPPGLRQQVLSVFRQVPTGHCQLLVPRSDGPPPAVARHEGPLMRVRLEWQGFPPVWQGVCIAVHVTEDWQPVAAIIDPVAASVLGRGEELEALNLPPMDAVDPGADDPPAPYSVGRLLDKMAPLRDLLAPLGADAPAVLAQLLMPGRAGMDLDAEGVILVGGEPELIQNPHDATCNVCREPMRFLFQFGDIVPGVRLGDAAVVYVYGCDAHREGVQAFIDSH